MLGLERKTGDNYYMKVSYRDFDKMLTCISRFQLKSLNITKASSYCHSHNYLLY